MMMMMMMMMMMILVHQNASTKQTHIVKSSLEFAPRCLCLTLTF